MILCVIKDRISGLPETTPIAFPNGDTAIKAFADFCKSEKVVHKEEFELIKIATYDDEKIELTDTTRCSLSIGNTVDEQLEMILVKLRGEE